VTVAFQVWNPQGAEAFEVLPNMNFTWSNNRLTTSMFPAGSKYFGAEVHQPVGIQDAFRNYILPRFRSRFEHVQIMNFVPIPDLPRLVKSEAPITPGASARRRKNAHLLWLAGKAIRGRDLRRGRGLPRPYPGYVWD
jgi:hypothetical protein